MNLTFLTNKKVYLASPYSHPFEPVKEQRFLQAAKYAGELHRRGIIFFSPICHSHPIAEAGEFDGTFGSWELLDYAFIDWADVIIVLGLEGWEKSVGIRHEIIYAFPRKVYLWKPQYRPEHLDSLTIDGENYIIHEG